MSLQECTRPDLPGTASNLFSDRFVVAITTAGADQDWAARAVWDVARAAITTGRRTALIDLNLEEPVLHRFADSPRPTGIVDAFLFGASLQHVASNEEDPNLYFIGVGTPPGNPAEIWGNDRWLRLARGFAQEQALLLLYLPASALSHVPLDIDLVVVVSPSGFSSQGPKSPDIQVMMDRGVPVVVVTDAGDPMEEDKAPVDGENAAISEVSAGPGRHRTARIPKILVPAAGMFLALLFAILVLLTRNEDDGFAPLAESEPALEATTNPSGVSAARAADQAVEAEHAAAADTLDFSIQVAAWASWDQADEHLRLFRDAGIPATVAVIPRDSARVWYRVLVGAVSGREAAEELLRSIRAAGLIGSSTGLPTETPYAYRVATHPDSVSAQSDVRGLRDSGIPAYIVSMPDGSVQVLVGAFDSPEQAELADSVFTWPIRELSRTLVARVGIAR